MSTKKPQVIDPFSRKPQVNANDLGEVSTQEDTLIEDMKKIEHMIPSPGATTTEEGYKKMLEILGKQEPPTPQPVVEQKTNLNPVLKPAATKAKATTPKEETKDSTSATQSQQQDTKPKTKSEELGLHYEDEEVLPIIDSLLMKGYASEDFHIKNAVITLRTTFFWEDQMVVDKTDEKIASPDTYMKATGGFYYDIYSLAANIERFGDNYFEPINIGSKEDFEESFNKRVEFLSGLASPLVMVLISKRTEFIKKVQYVVDNFEELIKAF